MDPYLEHPARWLAGFTCVDAGPGEEVTVDVVVPARAFAVQDQSS